MALAYSATTTVTSTAATKLIRSGRESDSRMFIFFDKKERSYVYSTQMRLSEKLNRTDSS